MLKKFLRALTFPFIALAAVILWFEQWLWEPIERLMRWIGGLPVLHELEELARRAPPHRLGPAGVPRGKRHRNGAPRLDTLADRRLREGLR